VGRAFWPALVLQGPRTVENSAQTVGEEAGLETRRTVESPPNLAVLLQAGLKPRAG